MTDSNVNPDGQVSHEINIKRLGGQQKEILRFMWSRRGRVHKQVEIIEELYGEVTDSRKASVSRSIGKLRDADIVYRQTAYYSELFEGYVSQRPRFGLTDEGRAFLQEDSRFPEITGEPVDCEECGEEAETFPEGRPLCHTCHDKEIREQVQEKVYS